MREERYETHASVCLPKITHHGSLLTFRLQAAEAAPAKDARVVPVVPRDADADAPRRLNVEVRPSPVRGRIRGAGRRDLLNGFAPAVGARAGGPEFGQRKDRCMSVGPLDYEGLGLRVYLNSTRIGNVHRKERREERLKARK